MTTAVASNPFASLNNGAATPTTANDTASADRFLKLLVTQLQNQDPLNPMDNAQITSQMAQINTVTGIDKLNTNVEGLSSQFVQMQALQGATLVGREITLVGNRLSLKDGVASGGFTLASTADNVQVEVLSGAGVVLDTLKLGAQAGGRHAFDWPAGSLPEDTELRFRVTATLGTQTVGGSPLMRDTVEAATSSGVGLLLLTRHSGDIAYRDVLAFN